MTNRVTGWADQKHDNQLGNLSQQIRTECGVRGLAILNQKINDHGWTSKNKMFSSQELNSLRNEVHTTITENNQLALEHSETIFNQRAGAKTQEVLGQIFGDRSDNDHSDALREYPEIAQKLQEFKSFTASRVKESVAREMASEKENRIQAKFKNIGDEIQSDLRNINKYPDVARFIQQIAEQQFLTESLNFATAATPYCTGVIPASPREADNLLSIVENFIDDRGTGDGELDILGFGGIDFENSENNNSENATVFVNISRRNKTPILNAYDDLKAVQNGSDAQKTQAVQTLMTKLRPAMLEVNQLIIGDKLLSGEGKTLLMAAAESAVEEEMLDENRHALGLA